MFGMLRIILTPKRLLFLLHLHVHRFSHNLCVEIRVYSTYNIYYTYVYKVLK